MNLETLNALFDSSVANLPEGMGSEMRADMNSISQKLKGLSNKKGMTHEELKLKTDFLSNEFKMKYGTKDSK